MLNIPEPDKKPPTMPEPPISDAQRDFLRSVEEMQLLGIFDFLGDTLFWIKDAHSRFVYANQHAQQALHGKGPGEPTREGVTDYDLFPQQIAEQFVADDRRVMAGEAVENRLEMTLLHSGELGWMSTSKYPLRNRQGQVIGTYGLSRQVGQSSVARHALEELAPVIDYVRTHYMEVIEVGTLARQAHLSISALERRFRKHLGKSPKQFMNELRLEKARHNLSAGTEPIATIAYNCGFSDPGYFSRQYHKHFGERPSRTRRRARTGNSPEPH